MTDNMREFESGATRDADTTKFDYDGIVSPFAFRRFAEYMHQHRMQANGVLRDSDNWQNGIPIEVYRKSVCRHWFDVWCILRGYPKLTGQATDQKPEDITLEDALCGVLFNVQGLLHEVVKARMKQATAESEVLVCGKHCTQYRITCYAKPNTPCSDLACFDYNCVEPEK